MVPKEKYDPEVIERILQVLESIDYGTVQITVHESQITQIEKWEKFRFPLKKQTGKK
ncbi:MAG: YezD family protein [Bacilli bacterium]